LQLAPPELQELRVQPAQPEQQGQRVCKSLGLQLVVQQVEQQVEQLELPQVLVEQLALLVQQEALPALLQLVRLPLSQIRRR
jgi:hypothetical protein